MTSRTRRARSTLPALAALALSSASLSFGQTAVTRPVVSEEACPVEVLTAKARDGRQATAVVRKPPGKGLFPALIYLHGGLEPRPANWLKEQLLAGQTHCRFLAAGYVTVAATFRTRAQDPLTSEALLDCLAVLEQVKKMPEVDPKSVVVWGDSGGGSLALELAGEAPLCAVAAQEPATVLFTGMYSKENLGGLPPFTAASGQHIMQNPKKYYTPELQKLTREKVRKISCPVFIAHGNVHPINKINNEIFIPELKEAGKRVEVILYPGEKHGFSHSGTPKATQKFFEDCYAFFKRHLPTQPAPLEATLIQQVPVGEK
jgi:dipeptidyl aminopeptidase/acylaminoacyl peptidase